MKILPQKSLFLQVGSLVLVWIVLGLLVLSPASADVGVHPILPGGSSLQPQEETPIQMAAEVVEMTVRPATEADNATIQLNPEAYGLQFQPVWYPAVAEVTADFTMRNPTHDALSLTAWFPLASALETVGWELNPDEIVPRIASFQVAVNGSPVDYAVSELPNPKGEGRPPLPWASFPVTFPPGEDIPIQVSYVLPLQPAVKGSELALYYIFQTGAGWAGPIGQAELILNLPYPAGEGTLAAAAPGSLSPPYGWPQVLPGIPANAVLEGNQARWTWQDFEPGPQDDFAVWLMGLDKWQELEDSRGAVQANPQDGRAWLDLGTHYYSLATSGYNQPALFSTIYLEPGVEAYQEAAGLLPEHPDPHAGLALLSLVPYMRAKNAPPEVIQYVQEELQLARELEEAHPELAEETWVSSGMVEDVLSIYLYNDATATAEWAAMSTIWAQETAGAAGMRTPSATPAPERTPTPQPVPSTTPLPLPTLTPTPAVPAGSDGQILTILLVAAGALGLVIVVYLLLKNR